MELWIDLLDMDFPIHSLLFQNTLFIVLLILETLEICSHLNFIIMTQEKKWIMCAHSQ